MTTETLTPVTVPLEPTTPIRPSEAIRLGCLLAPFASEGGWGYGQYACAGRALVLGMLGRDSSAFQYNVVDGLMSGLTPPCGWACPDGSLDHLEWQTPSWALIHLNDDHHWSRERIADWLAEQGL